MSWKILGRVLIETCFGKENLHEQGGVHDDLVVADFVLLLALLEDIPDEVAVLRLGLHAPERLLRRVAQVPRAALADDGRDAPHEEALGKRARFCEAPRCLL